ncbi:hypothetical protein G9A89_013413 [Geosiphon pyriformis]|nr:hypothetical protein G9A89_013413 [Geosiphon pyriformis]
MTISKTKSFLVAIKVAKTLRREAEACSTNFMLLSLCTMSETWSVSSSKDHSKKAKQASKNELSIKTGEKPLFKLEMSKKGKPEPEAKQRPSEEPASKTT